jgi:hypothetical protein
LLNRQAPWRGSAAAECPGSGLGRPACWDGWQLGGRLSGESQLTGTPAQPHLNGEWRGDDLAVRALDQGMRLERGKLLLQLRGEAGRRAPAPQGARFESDLQPLPRTLLLDPGSMPAA